MFYMIFQAKVFFQKTGARVEKGQGLIEYALIVLLIALVVIGAVTVLGEQIIDSYQFITDRLGEIIN